MYQQYGAYAQPQVQQQYVPQTGFAYNTPVAHQSVHQTQPVHHQGQTHVQYPQHYGGQQQQQQQQQQHQQYKTQNQSTPKQTTAGPSPKLNGNNNSASTPKSQAILAVSQISKMDVEPSTEKVRRQA